MITNISGSPYLLIDTLDLSYLLYIRIQSTQKFNNKWLIFQFNNKIHFQKIWNWYHHEWNSQEFKNLSIREITSSCDNK